MLFDARGSVGGEAGQRSLSVNQLEHLIAGIVARRAGSAHRTRWSSAVKSVDMWSGALVLRPEPVLLPRVHPRPDPSDVPAVEREPTDREEVQDGAERPCVSAASPS